MTQDSSKLERAQNGILSRAPRLELTVVAGTLHLHPHRSKESEIRGTKGEELAGCTRELQSCHDGHDISYRLLESPPVSGSHKAGCARHENCDSESRWNITRFAGSDGQK